MQLTKVSINYVIYAFHRLIERLLNFCTLVCREMILASRKLYFVPFYKIVKNKLYTIRFRIILSDVFILR